ncbi:MAG: hypothetical protein LiPW30_739 [Parcubacteria group bacterium LiPW_30]|nr:MAG: hypothetical protein LiPW30_739 [Parcubacteria group bacterium LiPW_30]
MKKLKKIIGLSLSATLIISMVYIVLEPAIVSAVADTATVTATVTEEISITSPSDATMSATIPGMTGNPGAPVTASLTWTVKTVNATGFAMVIKSSTTPSMKLDATYDFNDYTPAVAGTPDYTWSQPAAATAEFGFTVEPATAADTVASFLDNASTCNTGALNTADKCWSNVTSGDTSIINRTTNTTSSGEAEVVKFWAESNAEFLKEGSYVATITVTATMN